MLCRMAMGAAARNSSLGMMSRSAARSVSAFSMPTEARIHLTSSASMNMSRLAAKNRSAAWASTPSWPVEAALTTIDFSTGSSDLIVGQQEENSLEDEEGSTSSSVLLSVLDGAEPEADEGGMELESVMRKRKRKMNHHRYRKRRREQRFLRRKHE